MNKYYKPTGGALFVAPAVPRRQPHIPKIFFANRGVVFWFALGVVCPLRGRAVSRLPSPCASVGVPRRWSGPCPPARCGVGCRLRWFRLGGAFGVRWRSSSVGGLGLFLSCWFSACCVCFFSLFSCFVLFFFVALSCVWCWCPRFLPVSFRVVGGSVFRLVGCVRLVRFLRVPCSRVAWAAPVGARRGGLPPFRFLAVWAARVLLVGGLGCRLCLRRVAGGVGRFRWGRSWWRSAFAVFLVFFNICLWRLWLHPSASGIFAALNSGIIAVEMA